MSESFAELFENSVEQQNVRTNAIIHGTVLQIGREKVVVNVGLKSEGFINIQEFKNHEGEVSINEGDVIEVALQSVDNGLGHTLVSFEKAQHIKMWASLGKAMEDKTFVTGVVNGKVKGGLSVTIGAVRAFLPGSLVDVRPIADFDYLEGQEIEVVVIKMDEVRNNIVVSRKAVLQEANAADREALVAGLEEGQEIKGIVKNLADYGAFVDLGGVDGLLHITDISWDRVNHPSEKLTIGDEINVKVLSFDKEKMRVSLGLKQMSASPWDNLADRLPIGKKVKGTVSNITDYGAFVKIEEGVEGLVHTSELDWTNANARAAKFVKLGQEVDVVVLDVIEKSHRISLSIKQAQDNPWELFDANYKKGDKLTVQIRSITDFGLFAGLPGGIDGLVHLADISWEKQSSDSIAKNFKKGQEIEVAVLNVDAEKERISLGIKQLAEDDFTSYTNDNNRNSIVKGKVIEADNRGCVIELAEGITGYLKAGEISDERVEDASAVIKVGEEVEVAIIKVDRKTRNIGLSIKAKDTAIEQAEVSNYNKQAEDEVATSTMGDLFKDAK
jgi:small subunit ribosomal protein S1